MNQEWSTQWQKEQDDKDEELQNAIRASEQDLTRAMSWDPRAGAAVDSDDSDDDWFPVSSTRHLP